MLHNRSVPSDSVLPHLLYPDVAAAIDCNSETFGFVEHFRYGPPDAPLGARLRVANAWIMLATPWPQDARLSPGEIGASAAM